jgi:hypothetical protein
MKNLKCFAALAVLATLSLNAVHAYAYSLPDLTVRGWKVENGQLLIQIRNVGAGPAGASHARVTSICAVAGSACDGCIPTPAVEASDLLTGGGTTWVTVTAFKPTSGMKVTVTADVLNEVREVGEGSIWSGTNNTLSFQIP